MEVGAVKQAFNNELILLKKKLNQAKIQVIHKLTRKAKTLIEKKAPEPLKEKFKRKAEGAVKEVLILKKIKVRDIGKFIVTHEKQLQDHLNKPEPDLDRVCARLLLHKCLSDKYTVMRNKFSNVPIDDLLMSRQERRKIKKEAKEAQKNKNKAKQEKRDQKNKKNVKKQSGWEVEDVKTDVKDINGDILNGTENSDKDSDSGHEQDSDNGSIHSDVESGDKHGSKNDEADNNSDDLEDDDEADLRDVDIVEEPEIQSDEEPKDGAHSEDENNIDNPKVESDDEPSVESGDEHDFQSDESNSSEDKNDDDEIETTKKPKIKLRSGKKVDKIGWKIKELKKEIESSSPETEFKLKIGNNLNVSKTKTEKKQSDANTNKNKNLKEKITHKKFSKKSEDSVETQKKTIDPFFITSSGENYMSLAEIRPPDEVKEEHRKGNRQLRRARIFGHALKSKPRSFRNDGQNGLNRRQHSFDRQNYKEKSNNFSKNYRFDSSDKYDKERSNFRLRDNRPGFNDTRKPNFEKRDDFHGKNNKRSFESDTKPEKLHPSWEAKKKLSGIQPFQGKKIVFN